MRQTPYQLRPNEEREAWFEAIRQHLEALRVPATDTNVLEFALRCTVDQIKIPPRN